MTLEYLQNYWWLLVSVLGGILVFMLFVQGGQSMLLTQRDPVRAGLIVNAMGRKWELTFTTLVVFGGAAFASFPLFYSTSFGGAYWLWLLILLTFVLQAVSYEFRRKRGNLYGTRTYDLFLFINGTLGCILLGVAVGMFFFGGEFRVERANLVNHTQPVISTWAPTHGLEAICCWKNLLLGFAVLFLARSLACLYLINCTDRDPGFTNSLRRATFVNSALFLVLFLAFAAVLLTSDGLRATPSGTIVSEPYLYLHNYLAMWWAAAALVSGVVLVLWGLLGTAFSRTWRRGIWPAGLGVFLVVASLFWVAGYGGTAFYPSLTDPQSSLTLANASSSEFTLTAMSWVSLIVPFVLAYICYVWRSMDRTRLTPAELEGPGHKY